MLYLVLDIAIFPYKHASEKIGNKSNREKYNNVFEEYVVVYSFIYICLMLF